LVCLLEGPKGRSPPRFPPGEPLPCPSTLPPKRLRRRRAKGVNSEPNPHGDEFGGIMREKLAIATALSVREGIREQPWPGLCVDLLRAATCAPHTSPLLWLNTPQEHTARATHRDQPSRNHLPGSPPRQRHVPRGCPVRFIPVSARASHIMATLRQTSGVSSRQQQQRSPRPRCSQELRAAITRTPYHARCPRNARLSLPDMWPSHARPGSVGNRRPAGRHRHHAANITHSSQP
jgi:hypothetical protein